MQINDKPFSIYDFIGYLIPGIFGVYSSLFLYKYATTGVFTLNIFSNPAFSEETIISILLFYIVGHLLSFFSSMSVEKYSLWTLGYPSSYLFDKKEKIGYFNICKEFDPKHKWGSRARRIIRFIIRSIVGGILFPVFLGDFFVRHVFRLHDMYARPFEKSLLPIVETNEKKILEDFTMENPDSTGDTFRLIYHYAIEHSSNHVSKMQNYVALYGFTRTLTFIGCLLFWEWIIVNIVQGCKLYNFGLILNVKNFLILFGIFFITFFLYWDFNKFFRKFSMEAYLGAIVSYNKEKIR